MKRFVLVLVAAVSLVFVAHAAQAQDDAENCKDSPLISRFPGGHINSCENKEFDQAEMPTGKDANGDIVSKTLEGEYHYWDYATRDGVSQIQVFRNFETALKGAGFTIVYEDSPGTITAHKGDTWYMLENNGEFYYQTIVTIKAMQQEVTADASSLATEINSTGRVAVYGIHFDTGKAVILPDSESVLSEIVKMMQENADVKLSVEGHTDNVGSAAANLTLSQNRAQAVVTWLVGHGVAAGRLSAKGLGQTKPVADNTTEDGRAKNRRVELVKQ